MSKVANELIKKKQIKLIEPFIYSTHKFYWFLLWLIARIRHENPNWNLYASEMWINAIQSWPNLNIIFFFVSAQLQTNQYVYREQPATTLYGYIYWPEAAEMTVSSCQAQCFGFSWIKKKKKQTK